MIYVILGMHKSGTTLISQILHHSGINMGNIDAQISYDQGNKYERASTLALNLEILGLEGRFDPFINLPAPDVLQLTPSQRVRMREIIQNNNQTHAEWGFKDPRTCLTYPLWASELPEHKIITIYRPPGEIWPRFRYKRLSHYHKNPSRAYKLVKRWCEHNENILSYLKHSAVESLILSYKAFMSSDAEFKRLEKFVGTELTDKRRKSLYRSRSDNHPLMRFAEWLVQKQTGDNPQHIIERIKALRQKQIEQDDG